jgi:hypothetical protein
MISAWATAFALLTVVAFHVVLAQSQVALDRLEQQTKSAERRYEDARFEHARLAAPSRIMERAGQIGLVAPDRPPTVVAVEGEVPAPPDAPTTTLNGWTDVKPTLAENP